VALNADRDVALLDPHASRPMRYFPLRRWLSVQKRLGVQSKAEPQHVRLRLPVEDFEAELSVLRADRPKATIDQNHNVTPFELAQLG
jgi:hypothetical protein